MSSLFVRRSLLPLCSAGPSLRYGASLQRSGISGLLNKSSPEYLIWSRRRGLSSRTRSLQFPTSPIFTKFTRKSSTILPNNTAVDALSATQVHPSAPPAVGYWLLSCSALVFGIIIVGGVTRLTESGLSITEWKPITGVAFPTTKEDWNEEYIKYQSSPEYKLINSSITLEDFKRIYYMEWLHRVLGRLVGVAFIIPATYFLVRRQIRGRERLLLGFGAALIGFQGFLGWYMVKSGLDSSSFEAVGALPRVSQYRLVAHLGTAIALYAGMLWKGLSILSDHRISRLSGSPISSSTRAVPAPFRRSLAGVIGLVLLTVLSGGFVAGLDAGLIYNEFPYMGENIIPPSSELSQLQPFWSNLFENPTTVQFDHRLLGTSTYTAVAALFLWSLRLGASLPVATRQLTGLSFMLANLQVLLGISTLLYLVPVELAASHQAGSVLLLSALLATAVTCRGRVYSRLPKMLKQRTHA